MREKLIRILGNSKKSIWELIESWDSDLNSFLKTLKRAYEDRVILVKNEKVFLSRKYKKLVKPRLRVKICESCNGSMINFNEKKMTKEFLEIVKNRPKFKIEYFQGWMKPEEVIKRICLIDCFDGVADKNIVLIGDDDLVSIALGLTHLPKRIVALDIDEGLLEFIEKVAKEKKLEIETFRYDVSRPLPKKFLHKFDIFNSEPLETISGCLAFLYRGATLLKGKGSVGYFGLSTVECPFKNWKIFEEELVKMGFVITDIIRNFSAYPMYKYGEYEKTLIKRFPFEVKKFADTDWFKSWLLRVEALEKPKPKVKWNEMMKIEMVGRDDVTHPYSLKTVNF